MRSERRKELFAAADEREEYEALLAEQKNAVARLKADGFRYATATHDVLNPASGRVMQKCGMRYVRTYPEFWQPKGIWVNFNLYRIDLNG